MCQRLPWERLLVTAGAVGVVGNATPSLGPAPPRAAKTAISKPGCTAADNAGVALFHLDGLAYHGKTNFGVLRVTKDTLEVGARAAEIAGDPQIAQDYRDIARRLPEVHDAAKAGELAERLRPVAFRAWSLGASCKGAMTPQQLTRVKALAKDVNNGKLTMEEAVKKVKAT
mgnify:CR=1 FL=1